MLNLHDHRDSCCTNSTTSVVPGAVSLAEVHRLSIVDFCGSSDRRGISLDLRAFPALVFAVVSAISAFLVVTTIADITFAAFVAGGTLVAGLALVAFDSTDSWGTGVAIRAFLSWCSMVTLGALLTSVTILSRLAIFTFFAVDTFVSLRSEVTIVTFLAIATKVTINTWGSLGTRRAGKSDQTSDARNTDSSIRAFLTLVAREATRSDGADSTSLS